MSNARLPAASLSKSTIQYIVEQHAENASFLWERRDRSVHSHLDNLDRITALDDRLDANLDGILIAGEAGRAACWDQLEDGGAGELFAATIAMGASGDTSGFEQIIRIAAEDAAIARGFISALAWAPSTMADSIWISLLRAEDPGLLRLGCAVAAIRRSLPPEYLERMVRHENIAVRCRALRAIGELRRLDLLAVAQRAAWGDPDPGCGFWAGWSAALLGGRSGAVLERLWATALSSSPHAVRAGALCARCVPASDAVHHLSRMAEGLTSHRVFAISAACLGLPDLVPALLALMHQKANGRIAGWAFSCLTGIDLAANGLVLAKEDEPKMGPTDDPDDTDVAMDPDEGLPFPDGALVSRAWATWSQRFQLGKRYQDGRPVESMTPLRTLREGVQLRRSFAAEDVALQSNPGVPLFDVRARATTQRQALASRLEA